MSKFSADEYQTAIRSLMPRGKVWRSDSDYVQMKVFLALAYAYEQSDTDALAMLEGAFPSTATILLKEWEETLGLPDDCSISEQDSYDKRQSSVVQKLIASGGQTIDYFISLAESLGYEITITEYRQARAGISVCRDPINGGDYPFAWTVNAGETTVAWAWCGQTYAGDPLRSWGNKTLECALNKVAPSHTIINFSYEPIIYDYDVYAITNEFMEIFDTAVNIYLPK
ncbi:putative phage tail protein [Brenneria populi subsp. brevivirga]|uniref:YmfQ family protein n=1 Tax=Brenneria populi TaxID=1505588 RepID=UPI002E17181B|nr:putative phage tail protein [Brenneria populi subsp. brevivirga]